MSSNGVSLTVTIEDYGLHPDLSSVFGISNLEQRHKRSQWSLRYKPRCSHRSQT